MTNDDRFDELLQQAAREHNQAPETPRAEMWSVIAAERAAGAPATALGAGKRGAEVRIVPFTHVIPDSALLLDSVPPLVKTTSPSDA